MYRYFRSAASGVVAFLAICFHATPSISQKWEGIAIIPEEQIAEISRNKLEIKPPYWIIDLESAKEVRAALRDYIDKDDGVDARLIREDFDAYVTQFVGYTENGNRYFFINGICRSIDREMILMANGRIQISYKVFS